jgi:serine/threonine protein kinase
MNFPKLVPGTLLENRYEIRSIINDGGFGSVYLAFDRNLEAPVAIKQTLFDSDSMRTALKREAVILGNLRHNQLPRVTHHFEASNGHFLVMDFIEGDDLLERMKKSAESEKISVQQVLIWGGNCLTWLNIYTIRNQSQ